MYMSPCEEHHTPDSISEDTTPDISVGEQHWVIMCIDTVCGFSTVHPQLSHYPNPRLSELTKACNFHEFHYNLQDGGHLVMWSVFQPPVCYLISSHLTVFGLVLMLEVQKECDGDGDVDIC